MQRAMLNADNAYKISDVHINGMACKTNCLSSTAFRGFGCPQSMFIMEHCITEVAYKLGIYPETVMLPLIALIRSIQPFIYCSVFS